MKKSIIIATLALGAFVLGTNNIHAQVGANSNPSSTTVNLILADVISIDQGSVSSGGLVYFNYTNTTDYNTAKNVTVENSLIVTSSRNFDVKVKAVAGGTMAGGFNEITLSNEDQVLVSEATLGARKSLSIDYSISAENASTVLLGKTPGTCTQKVKYTATAL